MANTAFLSSAVRLPTPPPGASYTPGPSFTRKRAASSRSPSPHRRKSPPPDRQPNGNDPNREPDERERQLQARFRRTADDAGPRKPMTEEEKQASAKAEYDKLLTMRSGGTYIPPARLRALQSQITDKTSKEYQRMAWEALKKSINGLINKINVSNIKHIVPELFGENLIRGRGLFCRSIMKAQAASLPFTPIYAAMAAIVNTKLPQVGELLLNRLVMQFRKAFRRNDKAVCLSSTTFIAHLCNQQVAHETVVAQILLLLLHKPTDDSVEIAVGLTREVGQHLEEMSRPIALAVFDQFRSILHEADIDKRTQYMIEVLFQVRKDKYKDNPAIREELDLVEEEDQITHQVDLDGEVSVEDGLNIFKYDAEWEDHEEAYRRLKAEILGEGSGDDDDDDEEGDSGSADSTDEEEAAEDRQMEIKDQTNTDLVNLRKTIYLTIMSSLDFEEACHKLMKVKLPAGQEPELPSMIVECCAQEKTYSKFFGLIGERFAKLNRLWLDLFEQAFGKYYETIHRYETNRLRNIARFFGHLLGNDAIGWHVFSIVHLNEDETTSSSRIFIKILFQELAETLGLPKLQQRFKDDILRPSFEGIFPTDNARNTRFSINYFTSIGMGALTEEMREHLKNLPKVAPPALPAPKGDYSDLESVSSYSSYSSYTSRSYSSSRSPPRRRVAAGAARDRSLSRSVSGSQSPPPARQRSKNFARSSLGSRSRSRSRSPPRRATANNKNAKSTRYDGGHGRQGRGRSLTRSVSRSPSFSRSRSRSQPTTLTRRGGKDTVRKGGRRRYSNESMSLSRSRSRPRSHSPPRRAAAAINSASGSRRDDGGRHQGSPSRSRSRSRSRSYTPPPRRRPTAPTVAKGRDGRAQGRDRLPERSRGRPRSRSRSHSYTPSPSRSQSRSRSPPRRNKGIDMKISRPRRARSTSSSMSSSHRQRDNRPRPESSSIAPRSSTATRSHADPASKRGNKSTNKNHNRRNSSSNSSRRRSPASYSRSQSPPPARKSSKTNQSSREDQTGKSSGTRARAADYL